MDMEMDEEMEKRRELMCLEFLVDEHAT